MARSCNKKLSKLKSIKSMLKRFPSFSSRISTTAIGSSETAACLSPSVLHPVYVGKSRRRYLITSEVAGHPLLQMLLQRSGDGKDSVVECEVVLFEHLLWMLENGEGEDEAMDELLEFYAC